MSFDSSWLSPSSWLETATTSAAIARTSSVLRSAVSVVVAARTPILWPASESKSAGAVGPIQHAGAIDEHQNREIDMLAAGQRRGGGAAQHIDAPLGDRVEPVLRRHRDIVDGDIREVELVLEAGDDRAAEIDRETGRLTLLVVVGERRRVGPISDRESARFANPVERRCRRARAGGQDDQ